MILWSIRGPWLSDEVELYVQPGYYMHDEKTVDEGTHLIKAFKELQEAYELLQAAMISLEE